MVPNFYPYPSLLHYTALQVNLLFKINFENGLITVLN